MSTSSAGSRRVRLAAVALDELESSGSVRAAGDVPGSGPRRRRPAYRRRSCRRACRAATASRFIVPPAETTRSASATRLWASTPRSGTTTEGSSSDFTYSRWASVRGSTTAWTRLVAEVVEHLGKQRVRLAVVERHVGRRAHDDDHPLQVQPDRGRHGCGPARSRRGSTPPSGPGTGPACRRRRRSGAAARAGSCPASSRAAPAGSRCCAARRPLVVEHVHGGDLQPARGDREVVRAVREREVEAAALPKRRIARGATGAEPSLPSARRAAVAAEAPCAPMPCSSSRSSVCA